VRPRAGDPLAALGRVHLVGIGGAGMSGIARILLARGVPVSGSDLKDSTALAALRAVGADISIGHLPARIADVDTVVVSTAIRDTNPELQAAHRLGRRVLHRAEALVRCMRGYRGVVVAGTHGKTTTTSMLAVTLQHCGADPSFYVGGQLNDSGANAHSGSGDLFIAEADESDGSFLLLEPFVSVITNVEPDHLDHYADAASFHAAFEAFVQRTDPDGFAVVCLDDVGAAAIAQLARDKGINVVTYGTAAEADVRIDDLDLRGSAASFELVLRGVRAGRVGLRVPGAHFARNATAAAAVCFGVGLGAADIREGLAQFTGTRRRFEYKGEAAGIRVFDDYAHHPTEVAATLAAARQVAAGGRLVVAFQPHRYTRTAAFHESLGQALGAADEVVVMEVYSAGEDPIPGASGASVAASVPLPDAQVHFEPSWSAVAGELARRAVAGDVVLTLGAGDITMVGPEVLTALAGPDTDALTGQPS
jgi:UDP-N-acetylmuramate--alanine ligase